MDHSRTELIAGTEGIEKLKDSTVCIFGLGGVGGYALEAVARAGVGHIRIFDFDSFASSNCNRQILALNSTLGNLKTETALNRIQDINPDCDIQAFTEALTPDNISSLVPPDTAYAIDAIDDLDAKVALIAYLRRSGAFFISSMGAGNRIDPTKLRVDDISRTSVCPLARKVRKALRAMDIHKGVPCVYSLEKPKRADAAAEISTVGSISYMPGLFGLTAAGHILSRIITDSIS